MGPYTPAHEPRQGQPLWIIYSLRDVLSARAGQNPSKVNLGVMVATLKVSDDIFDPGGDGVDSFGNLFVAFLLSPGGLFGDGLQLFFPRGPGLYIRHFLAFAQGQDFVCQQ